jgi:hypothetical protein
MMDTGRVFIANLAKGKLGTEPANLLGALLVAQFQHAAMTRADVVENERRDFHLLIDEFHNFTTDSFAVGLSEARKYRLNFTLAHQYIEQVTSETRAAIFGNVGTIVSFRVGHTDAEVLAGEFGRAFTAGQFADLGQHQVLVRTLQDGIPHEPFQGRTHPPLSKRHGRRHRLIARSREKYSLPRAIVESKLNRWLDHS